MYISDDTIVAVSSAVGASARGIVRLSGPDSLRCVSDVFGSNELADTKSFCHVFGRCRLSETISCGAEVYVFRSGHSYTTQDMAELHLPGSIPILRMVVEALINSGARMAQPGEFTARAFFNGRIDLTEAEAVASAISARSDGQLRAAERLLAGELHNRSSRLAHRLAELLAMVEANIDFSEEEIDFATVEQLLIQIKSIKADLEELLHNSVNWAELEHLPQVVLAGPANSGKSSLVNRLVGIDRSIVSGIAGTTRDMLTAPLSLADGECMLIDTAGLGQTADTLAEETQQLTRNSIAVCDLLVWVVDITELDGADITIPADLKLPKHVIVVCNKIDLIDSVPEVYKNAADRAVLLVSVLEGDNVDSLRDMIGDILASEMNVECSGEALALTVRQRRALMSCQHSLCDAIGLASGMEFQPELLAVELREALDYLGSISGELVTEDILGHIFSRFCVGK